MVDFSVGERCTWAPWPANKKALVAMVESALCARNVARWLAGLVRKAARHNGQLLKAGMNAPLTGLNNGTVIVLASCCTSNAKQQ